jgi:hypothetical protein
MDEKKDFRFEIESTGVSGIRRFHERHPRKLDVSTPCATANEKANPKIGLSL